MRHVARVRWMTCASPAYLKARGIPRGVEDLAGHECIRFVSPSTGRASEWQFEREGSASTFAPRGRLSVTSYESAASAAIHGLGIAQVPDYMVADAHGAGRVLEVLRDFRPPPIPISVVYPPSRMLPPRVRVLIDALSERGAAKLRIRLG